MASQGMQPLHLCSQFGGLEPIPSLLSPSKYASFVMPAFPSLLLKLCKKISFELEPGPMETCKDCGIWSVIDQN